MDYQDVLQGVNARFGEAISPIEPAQDARVRENQRLFAAEIQRTRERIRRENAPQQAGRCPICDGTGFADVGEVITGYHFVAHCHCGEMRQAQQRIQESGLGKALLAMTFDSFAGREEWQKRMLRTAADYASAVEDLKPGEKAPWLMIGGQSGSGKTHLCTATFGKLLDAGIAGLYMEWLPTCRRLKAVANDRDFDEVLRPFQEAQLLYIDDLLKQQAKTAPTASDADVRVAFELLNARYNRGLPTLISSEWLSAELLAVDEATFSRALERAKGFTLDIARQEGRNFRIS